MTTVSVIYHSQGGYGRIMAEALLAGAADVAGVQAGIYSIDVADIVDGRYGDVGTLEALDASDAIVFGCPTHMGSVSTPMKALIDATLDRWYARTWVDKVAAGFTVLSTPSDDKLNALMDMAINAFQHGMIWVGMDRTLINAEGINRLSVYLGAAGQGDYASKETALMAGDRETGVLLGARVARQGPRFLDVSRGPCGRRGCVVDGCIGSD